MGDRKVREKKKKMCPSSRWRALLEEDESWPPRVQHTLPDAHVIGTLAPRAQTADYTSPCLLSDHYGCYLPPFDRNDPKRWFKRVDAAFMKHHICCDDSQYPMVRAMLDPRLLKVVDKDLSLFGSYTALKFAVLKELCGF